MTFATFFIVAECCLAFFGALLASLAITPVVRSRAEEWGFVDRPDGGRKAHGRAVALGGGAAVLVSTLVAAGIAIAAISTRHVAREQLIAEEFADGRTKQEIAQTLIATDLQIRACEVHTVCEQLAAGQTDQQIVHAGRGTPAGDPRVVAKIQKELGDYIDQVQGVLEQYEADPAAFDRAYNTLRGKIARTSPFFFGLLAAAILICGVGLLDDFVELPGRYKLAGQVVAALILVASGLVIERIAFFDRPYVLGILAVPFTLFWLLGAINAINLLDGIDGLAASVGFVLALTLAILALFFPQANQAEAIITLALAGSLLGFLRFNFAPATIFLGDSGSMLIGLVVGAIAIRSSFKGPATVALAVPFALWAVPIFDSLAAIVRRKLTGRSLFATDRGHLHHSLLVRGWSVPRTVLFIVVICATTCASALLSFHFQNELIAWLTVAAVVTLLILMGIFGHVEFALVRDRMRSTTRALSKRANGSGKHVHESRIRLQGSQEWDHLWSALTESAEDYHLTRIELTLNLPALHEAFYANWSCSVTTDMSRTWRMVCPLRVGNQSVGNVVIMGLSPDPSSLHHIGQVVDFLEPVEEGICRMVAEISQRTGRPQSADASDTEVQAEDDRSETPQATDSNEPVSSR